NRMNYPIRKRQINRMSEVTGHLEEIIGKEGIKEVHQQADISAQISKERKKKGLRQQALAEAIGVAKSTIGRIESGMTSPNTASLYKISSVLNVLFIINGNTEEDRKSVLL